jgi:hypothetical protein
MRATAGWRRRAIRCGCTTARGLPGCPRRRRRRLGHGLLAAHRGQPARWGCRAVEVGGQWAVPWLAPTAPPPSHAASGQPPTAEVSTGTIWSSSPWMIRGMSAASQLEDSTVSVPGRILLAASTGGGGLARPTGREVHLMHARRPTGLALRLQASAAGGPRTVSRGTCRPPTSQGASRPGPALREEQPEILTVGDDATGSSHSVARSRRAIGACR